MIGRAFTVVACLVGSIGGCLIGSHYQPPDQVRIRPPLQPIHTEHVAPFVTPKPLSPRLQPTSTACNPGIINCGIEVM